MSVPTTVSQELHTGGCLDGTVTLEPEGKCLMVRVESWSKHAFSKGTLCPLVCAAIAEM